MRKTLLALTGGTALALAAALAHAQDAGTADIALPWSLAEFVMIFPEAPVELFNEVDTDGNGEISEEELEAAIAAGLIADPRG